MSRRDCDCMPSRLWPPLGYGNETPSTSACPRFSEIYCNRTALSLEELRRYKRVALIRLSYPSTPERPPTAMYHRLCVHLRDCTVLDLLWSSTGSIGGLGVYSDTRSIRFPPSCCAYLEPVFPLYTDALLYRWVSLEMQTRSGSGRGSYHWCSCHTQVVGVGGGR